MAKRGVVVAAAAAALPIPDLAPEVTALGVYAACVRACVPPNQRRLQPRGGGGGGGWKVCANTGLRVCLCLSLSCSKKNWNKRKQQQQQQQPPSPFPFCHCGLRRAVTTTHRRTKLQQLRPNEQTLVLLSFLSRSLARSFTPDPICAPLSSSSFDELSQGRHNQQ